MQRSPLDGKMRDLKSAIEVGGGVAPTHHVLYRLALIIGDEPMIYVGAGTSLEDSGVSGSVTVVTPTRVIDAKVDRVRALGAGGDQTGGTVKIGIYARRHLVQMSIEPADAGAPGSNDSWLESMQFGTWPYRSGIYLRFLGSDSPIRLADAGQDESFRNIYASLTSDLANGLTTP